jgi:hypothetical protein
MTKTFYTDRLRKLSLIYIVISMNFMYIRRNFNTRILFDEIVSKMEIGV